jgi:ribosomal protein L3 glutamine methyltransferase
LKLGELIRRTTRRLARARLHYGHGTRSADEEAAWLVLGAMRLPPVAARADLAREVPAAGLRRVRRLAARRIREHIPLAYLLREAWLGGLRFYVDRRVIVPRSLAAELLRDEGLRPWLRRPVRRALDLCTGSGCLAILLAHAYPKATIDASDVSARALAVARRNVAHYRLGRRVRLVRGDLFDALAGHRYDLIVCNPPYVAPRAMRSLPTEYRREPALALSGGPAGLLVVRRVIEQARAHLRPRGLVVCEVGGARRALERAYPRLPFVWPEISEPGSVFLIEREALPLDRSRESP